MCLKQNQLTCCCFMQTHAQFLEEGCENCEAALNLQDAPQKVLDCTTENFEGMIALTSPEQSWVASWQFLSHFNPEGSDERAVWPGIYGESLSSIFSWFLR